MLLEINNLCKSFGDTAIIKDISLQVKKGETVSIIGPSGSGKSTLLRCATMLETVSGGEIKYSGDTLVKTVNGKPVYATGEQIKRIKKRFGLVFQNFNLFPHMTALENITLAPVSVLKNDKKQAAETALKLLKKVGLEDKANAYPCELSGGQKQRVAIARALAVNPDILFFDEPTSALDPELTGEILKVIKDLSAADMTMVIVTHEMAFARDVSDRIIFMDGGVVIESGDAKDVINNPKNERTRLFLSKFSQ